MCNGTEAWKKSEKQGVGGRRERRRERQNPEVLFFFFLVGGGRGTDVTKTFVSCV